MKNPKIESIMIIGKRWFDKVNGNTYCAARVYLFGVEVLKVPWTYGYGNYYEQVSREELIKKGFLPGLKKDESFYDYCQRNKINVISEYSEGLKRGSVAWGGR